MDKIPIIGSIYNFFNGEELDIGVVLAIVGVLIVVFGLTRIDVSQFQVLSILFALSPIWLPALSFFIFFNIWMDSVGAGFYLFNGRTTLEIKLPPEVFKSPEAMEFVLSQIHNVASPDNLMQTYLQGKRPLPYSLELVSKGGEVKFYVNVPTKKTTNSFQVNMYSQYPGVEIIELPVDYTAEIPMSLKGYDAMAFHMNKKKDEVYPIKLYTEFKLDMMPKEEEKVDPLTPMLEVLGSLDPHENLWIQFIITPHREEGFKLGQLRSAPNWEPKVKAEIDKLMQRDPGTKSGPAELEGMPRMTPRERSNIEAIELNSEKYAYETAIRWIYITPEGKFNGDKINMFIRSFSQWDVQGRNAIGVRWRTDFNYMLFSDPFGSKIPSMKREEFKRYKQRKYYSRNGIGNKKIFTAMELASIFHLPGKVAQTPNLQRVPSTRSEAPSNLPVGDYTP